MGQQLTRGAPSAQQRSAHWCSSDLMAHSVTLMLALMLAEMRCSECASSRGGAGGGGEGVGEGGGEGGRSGANGLLERTAPMADKPGTTSV